MAVLQGSALGTIEILEDTLYHDTTNDRLGIGTSTPSADLDVVGDVEVTGDVAVTGDSTFTGDVDVIGTETVKGHLYGIDGSDDSLWWKEYYFRAESVSPGGSGATLTTGGPGGASLYWLLDATNEYLYLSGCVSSDWDGESDIVIGVHVALNVNETANDTIDAELIAEYATEHDDMDTSKTQTRTISHDIGNYNSAGEVHRLIFILDHDLANNVIDAGDHIKLRFRLSSVASVTAVRFLCGRMLYRTKYPRQEAEAVVEG